MIESYQIEVMRKRRAAQFFWLIVFVCALFLYFFFQGYYPDIRLGMRRIFSESGSESQSGSSDLIKSFGIINVKTIPTTATITLGNEIYNNNEKRMSDYGDYRMKIEKEGYLTNTMDFSIDREKPFFIEKVSLLPLPSYRILSGITELYQVSDEEYIMRTASGKLIWSGATSSGKINYTGSLDHIGGKYFQTNTGGLTWETSTFERTSLEISNFIKTCPEINWKYNLFSCLQTNSILTPIGKYMTGITDMENHLIEQSGAMVRIMDMKTGKSWSQTGIVDLSKMHLINDRLYVSNSGTIIPHDSIEDKIFTALDTITSVATLGDDIVFIGYKKDIPHLIIKHLGDTHDKSQNIVLPMNISYSETELRSLSGNIIIQTPDAILFLYRGSHTIVWLVEGEILSYNTMGSAYAKDGKIWWADWSTIPQTLPL